jgi:hypothetical protein
MTLAIHTGIIVANVVLLLCAGGISIFFVFFTIGRITDRNSSKWRQALDKMRFPVYKLSVRSHPVAQATLATMITGTLSVAFPAAAADYELVFKMPISPGMCTTLSRLAGITVPVALFCLYSFLIQRVYAVSPGLEENPRVLWLGRLRFIFLIMAFPPAFTTQGRLYSIDFGTTKTEMVNVCIVDPDPAVVLSFAFVDLIMAVAYFSKFYNMLHEATATLKSGLLHAELTESREQKLLGVARRNFATSTVMIASSILVDSSLVVIHSFPILEVLMAWFVITPPLFLTIGIAVLASNPGVWEWPEPVESLAMTGTLQKTLLYKSSDANIENQVFGSTSLNQLNQSQASPNLKPMQ